MKICLVAPSLQMGGVERSSSTLANYLVKRGEDVSFVTIFPHPHFFLLDPRIPIHEPVFNRKSLNMVKTIFWLRRTLRQLEPEVVLVFNNIYGALTLLATIGMKVTVCTSDRSSPLFKWPWKVALFSSLVFRLRPPKGMIAQTTIAGEYARRKWGRSMPMAIIPNALREVKEIACTRQKTILAVGRLNDPLKGFDRLVKAFALVKNPEWKLVFAGGAEEGAELKKLASQLEVLDRIIFLGKVKDIDAVYAEAGIFVIPSRSEGFPNALCEAMAAGLPCISFDFVAGPRDIITHGVDGILVEEGNITAMANEMERLLNSEALREQLGSRAKELKQRLNEMKIGEQVVSFLQSIRVSKK